MLKKWCYFCRVFSKEKYFNFALAAWLIASVVSYLLDNTYYAAPIFVVSGYLAMKSRSGAKIFFGSALFFLVLIIPLTELRTFHSNYLAHSLLFLFLGAAVQIISTRIGGNCD